MFLMVSGSTSLKAQGAQKCIKKLRFTFTHGPRGQIKFKVKEEILAHISEVGKKLGVP